MLNKEQIDIFKIILSFKDISKVKLYVTPQDHTKFLKSFFKYKIYKKCSYIKWRNCVINYRIEESKSTDDSILYFVDYLKNNKK